MSNYINFPRFLSAVLLGACGEFCLFGFAASFEVEASDRLPWLLGYGLLAVCFFASATWRGLTSFGRQKTVYRQGVAGLIVGWVVLFLALLALCLLGPARGRMGTLGSIIYSLMGAPFGAAIGSVAGSLIGLKSSKVGS